MKMNNTYIVRTFIALAFLGLLSACVREQMDPHGLFAIGESLSVNTSVSEGTVVTRTASDDAVKETYIHTLDVFVEHVTNGTGDGTFINQYHLSTTDLAGIPKQVDNLLAERWRTEGLVMGEKYNIYVATNNTQTKETKDLNTFNVAALKALVANEVTDGVAVVNESNNNVTWGETGTSGNIYKLYDENPGTSRALTSEKEFMMDGVIKNWTPNPNSSDQVFKTGADNPLQLNRAAAKFVLNVKFDKVFLKSLTHNMTVAANGDTTWTEKPDAKKVTITGSPAWKFYNFAFGAPVFAPETQEAVPGVEIHGSDFNIIHNLSYAGDDKQFQIITYSYPNSWAATNYATAAPSLVISVGYTEGTGETAVTNYHYYRIPLVKSTVTAIERNHIYVINATIATRGSSATEDQDLTEDIQYAVLPWNDQTNSEVIENTVESVQHYYFKVNPKVYTLRGDGDQSVVLNYSKASGTKVNWKLFTYDQNGNQTGVVAKNNANARRAWFYDSDGKFTTDYSDNSGVNWSNTGETPMGVRIVQSNEGTSGSKGTVTVTSSALNNKGIKYIRLRVYLDEEETFDDNGNETMYEDIIIRHFPTDNIQSTEGKWSSYHDPNATGSTTTYKTTDLAEAQALAQQYGITYTTEEIETTEVINYATYSAHSSEAGYAMEGPQTLTRQQFRDGLTSNDNRRNANGQDNAILSDGWYYWGVNPREVSGENQADYYTSFWLFITFTTYYSYETRYRARYTHTYTYPEYTLELPDASTGDWVDWDAADRTNHSSQRTRIIDYNNGQFPAKVYNNGQIYYISESRRNGGGYQTTQGTSVGLTNNHMYVIQISSTSDDYVLGRPYINSSTHQSDDDVVSPAFMIASQLGAVSTFSGNNAARNAATHCSRYMEVTSDGHRYTGWRLPTAAEIGVITSYQYGEIGNVTIPSNYQVLSPVLTGRYYWSLSGELVLTRQSNSAGNYLRCVRDLSAEEIEALNNFDAIQEKYR